MSEPVLDFSFQKLISVGAVISKMPRIGLRRFTANSEGKYQSRSLRLSHNQLVDTVSLIDVLKHFLVEPFNIGWLDLSHNKITGINSVLKCFCELKELRVLYFHANNICNLKEVDILGQLKHLHTVTLHGNPIENTDGYRKHVILVLPHLKSMDFSAVTPSERALAQFWCKCPKPGITPEASDSSANE